MSVFGKYAKYYNLLYKEKNYKEEADYVTGLIKRYSPIPVKSILDIGCGTGNHAIHFNQNGFSISGIDRSQDMINEAVYKYRTIPNMDFHCLDAADFNLNKKLDAVVSLFHVMSYITSNDNLDKVFSNIYNHLENDGLFIFDFWYGPSVLKDRPLTRVKRLEDEEIRLTRLAEPVMHENSNIVDVKYEVIIQEKIDNKYYTINETHSMRYYFYPELEYILKLNGFNVIKSNEWLSDNNELNSSNWNGIIIANKMKK